MEENKNINGMNLALPYKLGVGLVVLYAIMMVVFYFETRTYALSESEQLIENILLDHKAKHAYVEDIQKPVIYKLQEEGKLAKEFFAPEVLSFTFIARNIHKFHKQQLLEAGRPVYKYKLASDNPRNPLNKADAFESELLKRFNADRELPAYTEITKKEGTEYLFKAVPIAPNKSSCMRCHGDPENAPKQMLERYGNHAGFYEKIGDIRAIISLEVPLDEQLAEARHYFLILAVVTTLAFLIIYLVILKVISLQRRYSALKEENEQKMIDQQERLSEANRKLAHLAVTDELSGLYNRRRFIEDMEREMERANRYESALSLIVIDLDHFKRINDEFGHDCGDIVIEKVADLLEAMMRTTDTAYRIGGEEFCLVAHQTTLEEAEVLAERLCTRAAELNVECGTNYPTLTISVGVAHYVMGESFAHFFKRADEALYRAKEAGRNRVEIAPRSL